jgi:hypothetical protein
MDGRRCRAQLGERLRLGVGDGGRVEGAEPFKDLRRTAECVLHRVLLVQEHS